MSNWNLKTMYLAASLVLGLSSCSVTKEIKENMILTNGLEDLANKSKAGIVTTTCDISVRTEPKEAKIDIVDKHYSGIKFIPYKQSGTNTSLGINKNSYMLNYSVPLTPKK
jgi:hypothetical protein